ncbi:hypothetical protein DOTSEDRAFT_62732 [Dothistroma septosporum NZE10]|uniref:Uncharacterized protein n=1 Tax=Dothistroma septosporum (strain NZE10 / CBS 128990) TaxID=675120 RepID=N1PLN5_DOTSN|nr:hypothetical protein DOTSEDRAFT_62732 [Dothistroma septosporum NZE10]
MKKTFSARRVPRKVGQDEEEDGSGASPSQNSASNFVDSALTRPNTKSRKSTSLRTSHGPTTVADDEESEASVVTTKRSTLSRVALQRNASKRRFLLASQLPGRQNEDEDEDEDDRPHYSSDALQELKASTPSAPQNFGAPSDTDVESVSSGTQALDISSKFGSSLARYEHPSAIPSAIEIAEKKARRARLAKEQQAEEYISLDPDDPDLDEDDLDENVMKDGKGWLVLKPKDKYGRAESRLVADDEDIMENFEDFTEDGRMSLGRKAEAEAARKRKQDMAAQIAAAEGASDSEDDSDRERYEAYEAAQTRHGTCAQNVAPADPADVRPKTPPTVTPLPSLDGAVERLRKQLAEMQSSRMQKLQVMEALQRKKIHLAEEEVRLQRALKETSEKFEALRNEKGIGNEEKKDVPAIEAPAQPEVNVADATDITPDGKSGEAQEEDDDDDEEEAAAGHGGLDFGGARQGLSAGFGLGFKAAETNGDASRDSVR